MVGPAPGVDQVEIGIEAGDVGQVILAVQVADVDPGRVPLVEDEQIALGRISCGDEAAELLARRQLELQRFQFGRKSRPHLHSPIFIGCRPSGLVRRSRLAVPSCRPPAAGQS
jgi:hypothetical protein